MATYTGALVEFYIPCIKFEGFKTNKDVSVGDGATVTLPSTTTIGGSAVVALGDITSSSTSATAFTVTNTGIFVGTGGVVAFTANSATTPTSIFVITANGITSGGIQTITSTGTLVTTANLLTLTANSATTAAGLLRINGTGLTDGFLAVLTGGGANVTASGGGISVTLGAATVGTAGKFTTTGTYTGTTGVISANGTGATSGLITVINATAATLTTGRYISCNDAATEVFGIGANGHVHSKVSAAPPTIAVTTQQGITAAAITAGGSDTCGIITTTGTSTAATVLDVTFGKTYTTAPKAVVLVAANAAAAMPNTEYIVSAVSATGFTITVAAGGTYAATPSFRYLVVA